MQSDTGKENDKSTHVLTTDSKKSDVQAAQALTPTPPSTQSNK